MLSGCTHRELKIITAMILCLKVELKKDEYETP